MCFSMDEYERIRRIVQERKRIREQLKDIKPSDFEKKEEKKEEQEVPQKAGIRE